MIKFHLSCRNFCESSHFDGLFLSKVYKIWPKKIQRGYLSWHWTVTQNHDLVVSKMAWGIGWTFIKALKNLKNCILMVCFCPKSNVSDRKFERNYVSWHWNVMQNLKEKLTLGSKNDMRNLENFNVSRGKSENLYFDVLLLSIAYKVSTKKVLKGYLPWHWKEIQTLKKNWLLLEKWHDEFGKL